MTRDEKNRLEESERYYEYTSPKLVDREDHPLNMNIRGLGEVSFVNFDISQEYDQFTLKVDRSLVTSNSSVNVTLFYGDKYARIAGSVDLRIFVEFTNRTIIPEASKVKKEEKQESVIIKRQAED